MRYILPVSSFVSAGGRWLCFYKVCAPPASRRSLGKRLLIRYPHPMKITPAWKAAILIVAVFCALGPPVGLLVVVPQLWMVFFFSYVTLPHALLTGAIHALFVIKLAGSAWMRSMPARVSGALIGGISALISIAGLTAVMRLIRPGVARRRHGLAGYWFELAMWMAAIVCGTAVTPAALRRLRNGSSA